MPHTTRRHFLAQSAIAAAATSVWPRFAFAADTGPKVQFPAEPRERLAVASYPFRDFISGSPDAAGGQKVDIKDFAAHCRDKLGVAKIEPWNRHFHSTDPQ